jgi:hypothetical protein
MIRSGDSPASGNSGNSGASSRASITQADITKALNTGASPPADGSRHDRPHRRPLKAAGH